VSVATPANGDIVVERLTHAGGVTYVVRRVPGVPQFSYGSRPAALSFASAFALRHRVGIWEQQGQVFTRLLPAARGGRR
jgi:hypothetical protein